jgi:membrane protease YdiL (CAAX protease family)
VPETSSIWIGSILLVIGGLALVIGKKIDELIAIILLLGILAIMVNFFIYIGMDKPLDERLKKIGTLSATYSWYITIVFITFLQITSYWTGKTRNMEEIIGIIIVVMVCTMMTINTYLTRKGEY